jgi:hypothetical protein
VAFSAVTPQHRFKHLQKTHFQENTFMSFKKISTSFVAASCLLGLPLFALAYVWDEYKSGVVWPEPVLVTPGENNSAPSDAIVLFDGTDMSQWEGGESWEVKDGYAIVRKNGVQSKQKFGDCQLHLEFATPEKVEGNGQGRGNSGIYFMGKYELQILDSFDNPTYFDGQCGAIYKQSPPMVNACRKPGEWQSYDVIFNAPKFAEDGSVMQPAYITVFHNGIVVHNHFELTGGTFWDQPAHYEKHADKLPIHLQFHGNPTKFRNIWIRENIAPVTGSLPDPTETPQQEKQEKKEPKENTAPAK